MSLNLLLINRYGIWQSTDHRLTDIQTGRISDDYAIKLLPIQCTDAHMLLAYAGLGTRFVPGRGDVHLSDWIRGFLRGESRSVTETMNVIRRRASIDLGLGLYRDRIRHMFCMGFFWGGEPYVAQLTNFQMRPDQIYGPISAEFKLACRPISDGDFAGVLAGFPISPKFLDVVIKYHEIVGRKPRKPEDFMHLLACANQRIARKYGPSGPISEHCTVTYVPPTFLPWQSYTYFLPAGVARKSVPFLVSGLDFTDMLNVLGSIKSPADFPSQQQLEALADAACSPKLLMS